MPSGYVAKPELIDFIVYTGDNLTDVVDAIEAVTGADTVGYARPSPYAVFLLVVNTNSQSAPFETFTVPSGYAVRTNAPTDGASLPISIIEAPSALVPYNELYGAS